MAEHGQAAGDGPDGGPPPVTQTDGAEAVPTDPEGSSEEPSFPIVGIGASAGGLQALQDFFSALPEQPDMAFVIVQHLSPDHESALAEIIQSKTRLSVNQVTEHPGVEPNCVYVIPPGKHLEMRAGHLHLVEIKRERGKPTAVDHLFRSLAREVGDRAVAVILSGTGSDGSLGLKAVKERAGLALVQTPADAEYDGMPKSAIATGLVDLTGTPAELAERLVGVRRSAQRIEVPLDGGAVPETEEQALQSVFAHLRQRTGHDFTHYKRSTILRRLARRLQVTGADSLTDYAVHLRTHADEAEALLRDFLISVTQFFRDPEAFDVLARDVVPVLLAEPRTQVRVWVPGCATGEEAYSLAILLCEHADRQTPRPDIQIFATDIDEEALARAREGLYPDVVAADLSDERLDRFFEKEGGGYRVKPELREMVLFAGHNLVSDPPFSRLDLVSCRNVLIYFNRAIQERAFAAFHYALLPDGYLYLGTSEAPESVTNGFVALDREARIYRRRDVTLSTGPFPFPGGRAVAGRPALAVGGARSPADDPDGEAPPPGLLERYREWTLEQYAPPRLLVDERYDLTHVFGRAGDYLRDHEGPVTLNAIDKVIRAFRIDLRTALYRAFAKGESVDTPFRRVEVDTEDRVVRLHVGPVGHPATEDGLAEIVFIELDPASAASLAGKTFDDADPEEHPAVHRLEDELRTTRGRLQATIEERETSNEELKASNEELQSMNEELQSTTEELETSKEELQSINEELTTVNQELKNKVDELTRSNSDLQNLMASMEVATLFLDRNLRLKRYTPRAADLFNVIPADIGRPFSHLSHQVNHPGIAGLAEGVLESRVPVEETVTGANGEALLLRILPYRTVDDRIDGAVVTLVDVTDLEAAQARIRSHAAQQEVVATLGERALERAPTLALFDEATRRVRDVLGADACKVLRYEPSHRHLLLVSGVGWTDGLVGEATVPDAVGSQAGYTLLAQDTVLVSDLGMETRFTAPSLLTDHGLASGMSVVIPSPSGDQPFGVLGVHAADPREFSAEDGRFLQSVANILANAIEIERQQKTVEEQLAEIEAIYETAPVGLAFLDESLRYRRINRRLADINGRPIEDHVGHLTRDVLPALAEEIEPLLERILRTGEAIENVEIRGASPLDSSDLRVWQCSYVPRHDDAGDPIGIGIVVRDVTDLKRAQEDLATTATRLTLALEGGGLGTFELDLTTGDMTYDGRALAMLGGTALLPLDVTPAGVHPADRDAFGAQLQAALDPADQTSTFESIHRHIQADGETLWLAARGQCLFEGEGDERRAVRLLGVILDVTELKTAQERVRRQLSEVESYFDAVPVGIVVLDEEGRYVKANRRVTELTGKTSEELLGRRVRDVLPEYAEVNDPYVQRVLDTGVPIFNVEMQLPILTGPESGEAYWLVSFYPLRGADGVAGVSIVTQNVTAIRKAQAGLERLTAELEERVTARTEQVRQLAADLTEAEQRERRRVAQILHDDLQQILYALQVRLELSSRAVGRDGGAADLLMEAGEILDRAVHVTRTLAVDLSPPVLRGEGLDRTIEWLAHRIGEAYNVTVTVESEGHIEVASTVQVLLFQCVRELLFNVVKHAGTGEALVTLGRDGDGVRLVVEDEGAGFDPAEVGRSSDRFGLHSVRERIQLVGGEVEVESAPGEGTRVTVRCPVGL